MNVDNRYRHGVRQPLHPPASSLRKLGLILKEALIVSCIDLSNVTIEQPSPLALVLMRGKRLNRGWLISNKALIKHSTEDIPQQKIVSYGYIAREKIQ